MTMFSPSSEILVLSKSLMVKSGFLIKPCSSKQTVLVNFALSFDEIAWHIGTTNVKRVRRSNVQGDVLYELAKILVLRHEVGLTIHLHEHANLPLQVNVGSHDAFFRCTRSLFTGAGNSFGAQNRLRFSQIAAALNKSALAIHETCVGFLA